MREDQVENGVNFLVHPKVKTAPLSQRISFLENKGLTPEEISAALSRVEADDGGLSAGASGSTTAAALSSSAAGTPSPFPAEAPTPLWRQVVVPGALVMGVFGALGTYYAASRSAERGGPNQSGDSSQIAGGSVGWPPAEYQQHSSASHDVGATQHQHQAEGGAADLPLPSMLPFDDGSGGGGSLPPRGEQAPGSAAEASSLLAGEFRRLTETMEQQTGHLVEAVGAMKALASRAEQDSSSLLAARVSSHTSELRAELGTIKQLLLLQAGVEGGGRSSSMAVAAAGATANVGVRRIEAGSATAAVGGAQDKDKGLGGGGGGGVKGSGAQSAKDEAAEQHADGLGANVGLTAKDLENEKSKDAEDKAAAEAAALAAIGRRKETARAALATLLAENTPQAAKDGIAMLRMLVANLVNQPNVPRYRRIASSNDNFKKRLLPLEGHRAMMEAVGFKAKGSLWEWTWHEDSGPSAPSNNKAVLEDVVKAIDAVARPNGPPLHPFSAAPTVPGPTAAARTPPPPASPAQPVAATATAAAVGKSASGAKANGVAQQQPRFPDAAAGAALDAGAVDRSTSRGSDGKASSARAGAGAGATAGAGAVFSKPAGTLNDVLAAAAEVNGVGEGASEAAEVPEGVRASTAVFPPHSGASAGESALSAAPAESQAVDTAENVREVETVAVAVEPGAPPTSMAEVAAAIQRGDEPPGIRVVEDHLSVNAQSLAVSSQPSPPKPWEVFAGAAANGVISAAKNDGGGVAEDEAAAVNGDGRGYGGGEETRSRPLHAVSVGP